MSHSEDGCIILYGNLYDINRSYVILNNNNITIITSTIGKLQNLQELDLCCNQITQICPEIGKLHNLRELYLSSNKINNMCPKIGQLQNLQNLKLSSNQINNMCLEIGQLQNLQELDLYCNQITQICPEIGKLHNLQTLYLSSNKINNICPEIGQLINLQKLYLSLNKMTFICSEIGQLQNLQELYLNNNQITFICPEIGQLQNLRKLYLHVNQITLICPEIRQLRNLQELYLGNNQITQIYPEIGQLRNLQGLHLSHNQITIIPANIIQCNNLRYFLYDNNPLNIHIECVQRFLNRIQYRGGTIHNLYTDSQNVHTSSIQSSVKKSIFNLLNAMSNFEVTNNYIDDEILTIKTKQLITEYIAIKETHLSLDCTFEEIFNAVWTEISKYNIEYGNEIKRRLNEELEDSECKCFTGRISRLINCLSGYSDKVQIEINDSEQIGNIISIIRSKYSDIDQIKQIVRKELTERNFSSDIIEEWISYI